MTGRGEEEGTMGGKGGKGEWRRGNEGLGGRRRRVW